MYFLRDFLNFHVFHSILNKHGKEEISSSKILSSHSYFSFFLYDFISSLSPRMVFSTLLCPMMPQSLKILHLIKVKSLSRVQLFATPWTVAHQAPPSAPKSGPLNLDMQTFQNLYCSFFFPISSSFILDFSALCCVFI